MLDGVCASAVDAPPRVEADGWEELGVVLDEGVEVGVPLLLLLHFTAPYSDVGEGAVG